MEAQVGKRSPATQTEKSWQTDKKKKKPLNPSSRNDESQAYEINKWALRR